MILLCIYLISLIIGLLFVTNICLNEIYYSTEDVVILGAISLTPLLNTIFAIEIIKLIYDNK